MLADLRSHLAEKLAVVERSGVEESVHFGHACVVDRGGDIVLAVGDPDAEVLARSTLKPLQALAAIGAGAELDAVQTAVAAGSHTGEQRHQALAAQILSRHKIPVTALKCPADWPEDEPTRHAMIRRRQGKSRLAMNCSGKHAAMLAASSRMGWDLDSYLDPGHPMQARIFKLVEDLAGQAAAAKAVDGCGAPTVALSVRGLAVMAVAIACDSTVGEAMLKHPWAVGGAGHINTAVMRATPGLIAKGGAEGVLVMALTSGLGVAVKIIDGSPRASTLVALELLRSVGIDVEDALAGARAPVAGGSHPVGAIRATPQLRSTKSTGAGR